MTTWRRAWASADADDMDWFGGCELIVWARRPRKDLSYGLWHGEGRRLWPNEGDCLARLVAGWSVDFDPLPDEMTCFEFLIEWTDEDEAERNKALLSRWTGRPI